MTSYQTLFEVCNHMGLKGPIELPHGLFNKKVHIKENCFSDIHKFTLT